MEQLQYLEDQGHLPQQMRALIPAYRDWLRQREQQADAPPPALVAAAQGRTLNRAAGAALDGPAINPELDFQAIEASYFEASPEVVHFDGLLTPGHWPRYGPSAWSPPSGTTPRRATWGPISRTASSPVMKTGAST